MTAALIAYDEVVGEMQSTHRSCAIKYGNPSYPLSLSKQCVRQQKGTEVFA